MPIAPCTMTTQIYRPCRDLARRQIQSLIEIHHPAPSSSVAEIARNSRRQFHQTTPRREDASQPVKGPSKFAKILTGIATTVLPRTATQPYAIFGATEAIFKACSAPAKYEISENLRKTEDVPMTEDGEEIGLGGGVWHQGSTIFPLEEKFPAHCTVANTERPQSSASSPPSALGRK